MGARASWPAPPRSFRVPITYTPQSPQGDLAKVGAVSTAPHHLRPLLSSIRQSAGILLQIEIHRAKIQ